MIDQLLKIAEESDTQNKEKLAYISQLLDMEFTYKEEYVKEAQEYLEDKEEKLEKTAIDWGSMGKTVGNTALKGLGIVGAAGAGMIGTSLVNDMYGAARNALTKSRNFDRMVQSDPSLAEYPAEKVKAYFTTLHEKGGPDISGDPLMASAFVKQQLDFHGTNILDQVGKVISMRSTLDKSQNLMGKVDFSELLKPGRPGFGGNQSSPPTHPGPPEYTGPHEGRPGGYFGG